MPELTDDTLSFIHARSTDPARVAAWQIRQDYADLLAEVDRLRNLAEQQSASLTAFRRHLDEQRIALDAHDAAQRADESRAAVANLRVVELNAEAAQLRARVAELEAASGQRQEEMSRYWAAEVIIERAMAKGYDPDRYALAEALDLPNR